MHKREVVPSIHISSQEVLTRPDFVEIFLLGGVYVLIVEQMWL
jgi:hypothetical protein